MKKVTMACVIAFVLLFGFVQAGFPHCDTMDGPVVSDAKKAFEHGNVNYVLKWVRPDDEAEITRAFELAAKVRRLNPDAKELADRYFYDTLVRVHRAGEGVPFTGVKPSGTPIDEKIAAADRSIELGNIGPLEKVVPGERIPRLKDLFEKVMALRDFHVNDVKAGRKYIEAYVQFFHFAEGEEGHGHAHGGHIGHSALLIPVVISGLFFIISIVFGVLYFRAKKSTRRQGA
jgi:hypothetical protein